MIGKYIDYVSASDDLGYYEGQGILFSPREKENLFKREYLNGQNQNDPDAFAKINFRSQGGFLNRLHYVDLFGWIPDVCMAQIDRMSMAHGLEARTPYLDHILVGNVNKIPPQYKIRNLTEKYILRKSFKDHLPPSVLNRRKRGFALPINKWLFENLWEMRTSRLEQKESIVNQVMSEDKLVKLLARRGDFRQSTKIFGLLTLDSWARSVLEVGV
jgi:asparagine synthase (glutamine-hydrolysing)